MSPCWPFKHLRHRTGTERPGVVELDADRLSKGFLRGNIECVKIESPYRMIAYVPLRAVSLDNWAKFIRTELYFIEKLWNGLGLNAPGELGDSVLRRVRFNWNNRNTPVRNITWYEAAVYCSCFGGRLMYLKEWQMFRALAAKERWGSRDEIDFKSWCEESYNPLACGINVRPEPPLRKRLGTDDDFCCLVPHMSDKRVGFYVAYPADLVHRVQAVI